MCHPAQAARVIDYLYVEANEGDSSGGHVALRFGDETFHFQHETPGILRVRRIESAAFDHAYTMLGNRTIRESRIAVSGDTYALLRDAFNRLYLIQDAQLEFREALRRDVTLFELLLRRSLARPGEEEYIPMPLKGPGYFLPDGPSPVRVSPTAYADAMGGVVHSNALISLINRICASHDKGYIAERLAQARTKLRDLELRAAEPSVTTISPDGYPSFNYPASDRYTDALFALSALEILQAAPPLRSGTFRTSEAPSFKLEPQDLLFLQSFAERLEGDLIALLDSSRPDWGLPFILGMARLAAIEASLSSGRFVFLDVFPGAGHLTPHADAVLRRYMPAMTREKEAVFLRRRMEFFSGGRMREADFASLEREGNLLIDLNQAIVSGSALRNDVGTSFPFCEALISVPAPGHMDAAYLTRELAAARTVEREYAAALSRLYSYDLVSRNCVTEIFAVINHAIAQSATTQQDKSNYPVLDTSAVVRKDSEQRLGGFIDASRGLTFIPFVSAREVSTSYAVFASREQLSYRTVRLAEMNRLESPLKVFLRESNTLTSTLYRPGPDDSKFLFFTDDTLLLRPLFGIFNLIVGLGESLIGISTMPADGPDRLLSGTKGVLFSLPELVFVNIRKGSTAYVDQSTVNYR